MFHQKMVFLYPTPKKKQKQSKTALHQKKQNKKHNTWNLWSQGKKNTFILGFILNDWKKTFYDLFIS